LKILIIDIDSTIPNYALKKVEKYHLDKGDEVVWNLPLYRQLADKVYVSCIFTKNKGKCFDYEDDPKCLIGGSGYSLDITLPEEIEEVKPHINLGFTTRGCIRKCEFCIVPKKEGNIYPDGDLLDLWDGKTKDVVLLDNNILALPLWFNFICSQARDNKIRLDFNQGLDHRLLTQKVVDELSTIYHSELHFAWDNLSDFNTVEKALDLLEKNNISRCNWLILAGYNTTFEEDLLRVKYLRNRNQVCYLMRYNGNTTKELTRLSRWVNNRSWFRAIEWEEFLERNYKRAGVNS
jgi:hypothetical protein